MAALLVLIRPHSAGHQAPERAPIGRAALQLARDGIEVIFGGCPAPGRAAGWAVKPGRWVAVEDVPIAAAHDRFPSQTWAAAYREATAGLGTLPMGNPPSLTRLCRDKLQSQRTLEAAGVPMPDVEGDPACFEARLNAWGAGFLKPRHGAMGRGVRQVRPGDPLPARGEGAVRGALDDLILQRAVTPPTGLGGISIRALFQRAPGGAWRSGPPVARISEADPVVNVARGAAAAPASEVCAAETLAQIEAIGQQACAALSALPDGALALELGIDFAVDAAGVPHLIEVNSRPRGRLAALAALDPARFQAAHVEACGRPMRYLSWLVGGAPAGGDEASPPAE